ncbi:uncharacterized protein LAJ45_02428 [Morchella importuna]|uniref:uncharacterized protein n=1 Tax=Morchella importuna TaxID=1174673 RepID=UPI001E8EEE02|nr:uncharacterized protein LAJ45_02428 [Morchella importuna]KAH8153615.1 hypothetical protein LAJ45_02428 [Morchella importuna]
MGWFWPDAQPNADKNSSDPFHRLDPQVREFLLRESPLKPAPAPTNTSTTSTTTAPKPADPTTPEADPRTATAPTPSKYGDRYADIWAQYQPPSTQDAAKSASEQLTDIIKAYQWRKGAIGRAALENCANEQWALHDCYRNGTFAERMTACSGKSRRLNECYVSQANFLRAMGYMSDYSRDPAVDERIQMHADKLYQEQVKQDEMAAAAKKEPFISDPPSSEEEKSL